MVDYNGGVYEGAAARESHGTIAACVIVSLLHVTVNEEGDFMGSDMDDA